MREQYVYSTVPFQQQFILFFLSERHFEVKAYFQITRYTERFVNIEIDDGS